MIASKTIYLGSIYTVSISGLLAGVAVAMDETWSAAMRVTTGGIGGTTFLDVELTLAAGKYTAAIDTAESPWVAGTYFYDVRITPPGGSPVWGAQTRLTLKPVNSPAEDDPAP